MYKLSILFALIQLSFFGCYYDNSNRKIDSYYNLLKNKFDKSFTSQFPDSIEVIRDSSITNSYLYNENRSKHDVGFLLYEYGVTDEYLQTVENKLKGNHLARYKSTDSCLFVVNRFETPETYENRLTPKKLDSTLINRPCYKNMYPIPHFLDYKNRQNQGSVWLSDNFDIYVLEAKSINPFKNFQMEPFVQMPVTWKNGYSKGIAISEKEKTVIYWSIMW